MADVLIGYSQATYNLTHQALTRPMAITLGHSLLEWTGTNVQAADALFNSFEARIMPALDNELTLQNVDLFIGNGASPSGSVSSTLPPATGGVSWAGPVLNTAVIVRKETGALGRRGKGRFFLPGAISEGAVTESGVVDQNLLDDINAALLDWWEQLTSGPMLGGYGNLPPVVNGLSNFGPGTPLAYDVLAFTATNKVGTQRRRIR